MPHAYEEMRNRFAKGAKKDSPGYNRAQTKAARIYNSKHPNNPMGSGDEYEDEKSGRKKGRKKRKPIYGKH